MKKSENYLSPPEMPVFPWLLMPVVILLIAVTTIDFIRGGTSGAEYLIFLSLAIAGICVAVISANKNRGAL